MARRPAPKPLSGGFVFVDENKDRAEEQAMKWLAGNYKPSSNTTK